MITDPSRTIPDVAAAMIWLGLDPQDAGVIDSHQKEITDCMNMLNDAAQRGEVRYYDKKIVKTIAHPGLDEPIKIFAYTFSLQSLIDFAKIKNHKLVLLDGKARSKSTISMEKPLATKQQSAETAQEQSPLMKIANEIQRQFWSTFDKDAPGAKAPTQVEIVTWVRRQFSLTEAAAKAVEKVACPFDRDPSKR